MLAHLIALASIAECAMSAAMAADAGEGAQFRGSNAAYGVTQINSLSMVPDWSTTLTRKHYDVFDGCLLEYDEDSAVPGKLSRVAFGEEPRVIDEQFPISKTAGTRLFIARCAAEKAVVYEEFPDISQLSSVAIHHSDAKDRSTAGSLNAQRTYFSERGRFFGNRRQFRKFPGADHPIQVATLRPQLFEKNPHGISDDGSKMCRLGDETLDLIFGIGRDGGAMMFTIPFSDFQGVDPVEYEKGNPEMFGEENYRYIGCAFTATGERMLIGEPGNFDDNYIRLVNTNTGVVLAEQRTTLDDFFERTSMINVDDKIFAYASGHAHIVVLADDRSSIERIFKIDIPQSSPFMWHDGETDTLTHFALIANEHLLRDIPFDDDRVPDSCRSAISLKAMTKPVIVESEPFEPRQSLANIIGQAIDYSEAMKFGLRNRDFEVDVALMAEIAPYRLERVRRASAAGMNVAVIATPSMEV